jgi:hypothetical protein
MNAALGPDPEKCEIGYAPTPYSPSVGARARDTDRKAARSRLSSQNAKNAVTEAHFLKSGGLAKDMRSYSPMPSAWGAALSVAVAASARCPAGAVLEPIRAQPKTAKAP